MNSPPLAVPHTQNTAPVIEFRCLYTQDVRRKQKRWQDGRLKFHTFNKRVMVYDERSNFIGDAHWREDSDFNEGEELELERGGILVEVGECVGKKDQDLSELVDKRIKERQERAAAKAVQPPGPRASLAQPQMPTAVGIQQLRPKPLNAVIGLPTGHYGRATVSNLSPFEQKHLGNQDEQNGRPAKRQKQSATPTKSGYAQKLMGATLTLGSTRPSNTQTIRYEPLKATICRPQAGTIDLTLDEDGDGVMQGDTRDLESQDKRPDKMQKRNSSRNPNSSGGYASNLIGAPLALLSPAAFASTNSAKATPTKAAASPYQGGSPGTSTSQTKVTARPTAEPKPTTKSKATAKPKPPQDLDTPNQQLSSSILTSEPPIIKPTEKPATSDKNKSTRVSLATKLIAEKTVTPLRIKPRPPRKLMMLMDISRPRQPAPDMDAEGGKESFTASRPKERPGMDVRAGSDLTSPSHCGLNADIYEPSRSISATMDPISDKAPDISRSKLDGSAITHRQTDLLDAYVAMEDSTNTIHQAYSRTADNDKTELEEPESSSLLRGTKTLPQQASGPDEAFESLTLQRDVTVGYNNVVGTDKPSDQSESASMHGNLDAADELIMAAETDFEFSVNQDTVSTVSAVGQPRNIPLPLHTDFVPAAKYHRQNTDTSVILDGKVPSHPGATMERENSEPALDRSFAPREMDIGTNDIAIKPSPTSSTIATIVDQVDYPEQTVEEARGSIVLLRGRFVNPATTRSSAKATASRNVNARVPASNILPGKAPDPSRTPARAETVHIKEDAGSRDLGRETISRGPWSRESFDLFGTWRPPGRAANYNLS